MNDIDPVQLISRWLHITAAAAAVGGAIFMKFALHPASEHLPETERKQLREGVRSRWAKVVMGAITVLIATGLLNFFTIIGRYDLKGTKYHMFFGIKVLVAFGVFALASFLVGRSELGKKLRQKAGTWLTVLVSLALLVILLSNVLKSIDHKPKTTAAPAQSAGNSG